MWSFLSISQIFILTTTNNRIRLLIYDNIKITQFVFILIEKLVFWLILWCFLSWYLWIMLIILKFYLWAFVFSYDIVFKYDENLDCFFFLRLALLRVTIKDDLWQEKWLFWSQVSSFWLYDLYIMWSKSYLC